MLNTKTTGLGLKEKSDRKQLPMRTAVHTASSRTPSHTDLLRLASCSSRTAPCHAGNLLTQEIKLRFLFLILVPKCSHFPFCFPN